jgi:hypothetical protein
MTTDLLTSGPVIIRRMAGHPMIIHRIAGHRMSIRPAAARPVGPAGRG